MLLEELSELCKQKGQLLRDEARLWDRVSAVLSHEPVESRENKELKVLIESVKSLGAKEYYEISGSNRVLRLPEVIKVTGLSRSTIYSFLANRNFPKSIRLGARSVGWYEKDIAGWLVSRASSR